MTGAPNYWCGDHLCKSCGPRMTDEEIRQSKQRLAELYQRRPDLRPAHTHVGDPLMRYFCPNCVRTLHLEPPRDDGEFYPVTCQFCKASILIDALGQARRPPPPPERNK
jgi:hypothetical protein